MNFARRLGGPENGTLTNNFGGQISEDDVELHQDLPDVYRLGIRGRPAKDIELRLFGDFTRWSQMERQCAVLQNQPRNWNDTFGVRAGASLWTNKATELLAGAGYSSNAVPDETLERACRISTPSR
jgi:long-chain fatty acid transport protein